MKAAQNRTVNDEHSIKVIKCFFVSYEKNI